MAMETRAESDTRAVPRWRDLREWLALVKAQAQLREISGATSEEDIGAITEMCEHVEDSPALLFDDIVGFEHGYRVLSNSMGTRERQAITLGLDPLEASHEQLIEYWRRLLRGFEPIPMRVVQHGAVLQNVLRDDAVDLSRFPAPIWHPMDGGRYIGTASINIMRDPDTGIINAGTYRNQLFNRNSIGIRAFPPHHGGIIRQKYVRRGERTPIVVVVGADPLLFMASCVEGLRYGDNELNWAGGLRGEPIEVIEGELTGLPIPAHAEIALEGFISAEEVEIPEGPYGEWQGYYQEGWPRNPVIQIDRVYHRDDPIILGCPQGKPPHEDNRFLAYLRSGLIWDQLEKAGVPNVVNVWSPPEGGNRLMTVVAIEQAYPGHAKQTAHIAAQCAAAVELNRITVVVDHHVDATSLQDVMWAILTRCDPARDVDIIARTKGMRIDVAVSHEDREARLNSRMIIDATAPFELADQRGGGAPVGSPQRSRATREKWGWVLNRTVDSG